MKYLNELVLSAVHPADGFGFDDLYLFVHRSGGSNGVRAVFGKIDRIHPVSGFYFRDAIQVMSDGQLVGGTAAEISSGELGSFTELGEPADLANRLSKMSLIPGKSAEPIPLGKFWDWQIYRVTNP